MTAPSRIVAPGNNSHPYRFDASCKGTIVFSAQQYRATFHASSFPCFGQASIRYSPSTRTCHTALPLRLSTLRAPPEESTGETGPRNAGTPLETVSRPTRAVIQHEQYQRTAR